MSLKKKITLSFIISSSVIAVLVLLGYINFIEIRKEIQYLELADTVRSKSLQLRRHEKNFFLYGGIKEIGDVYLYLNDLTSILKSRRTVYSSGNLLNLESKIGEYGKSFNRIEIFFWDFHKEFDALKQSHSRYAIFFPIIESTLLERPIVNAELLENIFSLGPDAPLVKNLQDLDNEIKILRKAGEEILTISRDLDKSAREKVENSISVLQSAALILVPASFLLGLGALFIIIQGIVKRLKTLSIAIEKAGKGDFSSLSIPQEKDEVGELMIAFNKMEHDLTERDSEILMKNEELLRGRKLASIGAFASGVAHELNNPLNNIYISAQVLQRESAGSCPPLVKETLSDIVGQTIRVKRIVGDLLEYAKGKEPRTSRIELNELIMGAYKLASIATDTSRINFTLDTDPHGIMIDSDPQQMERVFINIFTNAIEAMSGSGDLGIKVVRDEEAVKIKIFDTGVGMSPAAVEKIFEPFYTTKDKGTGLGLAISFNIIKKHGGEIYAESEKDKGTTFTVILPRGKVMP